MIRRVVLRRFKRFEQVEFAFGGHVVLAGPNNSGKTTLLQAIAAWELALRRWRESLPFSHARPRHRGAYAKVPLARAAFEAVPLRSFALLWSNTDMREPIEVEVHGRDGWTLAMEFLPDTPEQLLVRPAERTDVDVARDTTLTTVYVPPMTGLVTEEPLYANRAFVDLRLAQARPGEVLRNVLYETSRSERAWHALADSIRELFGYELLPPDAGGAHIVAEYRMRPGGPSFDVASAGSGFQQVLLLLAYLNARRGAVLLLDEPDAHLHVILQDAIYGELRSVAARQGSQLIIATHAEVLINAVAPEDLCVMLGQPRALLSVAEKRRLVDALRVISNEDLMLAQEAPGILYLEDYTDLLILREWARALAHPAQALLTTRLFWKKNVVQPREGARGVSARDHYEALALARPDLPGLELVDGDARPEIQSSELVGRGLQRLRWRRYEIESYLLHPAALERFLEAQMGTAGVEQAKADLRAHLARVFRPEFLADPLHPEPLVENYLRTTKARTEILPPLLDAAGLPGFPYTRYHEIAAVMLPEEIHPEVREKLDGLCQAFGQ